MKNLSQYIFIIVIVALAVASLFFLKVKSSQNLDFEVVNFRVDPGNLTPQGNTNAPVQVIEFGDYLCPFCGKSTLVIYPQLKNLIDQGKIVFYYRDLVVHPIADSIANSAWCANEQGKFWEYNENLFKKLLANEETKTKDSWISLAQNLNLDLKKFEECINSNKYLNEVQKSTQYAFSIGAQGTPTFFIQSQNKTLKVVGFDPQAIQSAINFLLGQ